MVEAQVLALVLASAAEVQAVKVQASAPLVPPVVVQAPSPCRRPI